jgi:opacity protein-like surface antigen
MFNALLDFETETTFTPYIGAGLGVAFVKGRNTLYATDGATFQGIGTSSISDTHSSRRFAWSLTGGGAWELTDNMAFDLGYRFFHFGNLDTGQYAGGKASYGRAMTHEVMLGLRFSSY